MNEPNDKLEKLLRDRLADKPIAPPAEVWDRISASMAEIDAAKSNSAPVTPITIAPRQRRLGVRRAWQYGIAAMVLLGIGVLANRLTQLVPQPNTEQLATVLYDPAKSEPVEQELQPSTDESTMQNTQPLSNVAPKSAPAMPIAKQTVEQTAEPIAEPMVEANSVESSAESTNNHVSAQSTPSDENHTQPSPKTEDTKATREQFERRLQEVMAEQNRGRGGRVTTSLYASNLNGSRSDNSSPSRLAQSGMATTEVLNSSHGDIVATTLNSSNSVRQQLETDLNHHVPFTVGVGVQCELTDRWAIETGVTYTLLRSTATAEGAMVYETTQQLHYVGVPISASYKFINGNRAEMYLRAGGAVERAVAGKQVQQISVMGENQGARNVAIDCQGVQLSVAAAVGAELKLSRHFGIYAEAGAGYFFDNNQPISYRTNNPLSLTLQAGVRVHLREK